MSADRKEIDLIIQAQLKGGRTVEEVTKSIRDLEKAITEQAAAAKEGKGSIEGLRATYLSLQQAQDRLKGLASLIGQFQQQNDKLEDLRTKAKGAADAYSEFKTKLDGAGKSTDAQLTKLTKLAATAERTEKALARQTELQSTQAESLKAAGVALDDLNGSQLRVRQSAADLGVALNKTQTAISTYADDARRAAAAERELAETAAFKKKAEDAARLVKAQEYISFWTQALNEADIAQSKLANDNALRKAADDAIAAANGYRVLGSTLKTLNAPDVSFKQAIQDIISPSNDANKTLDQLEANVKNLNAAVTQIRGPVANYREELDKLTVAQKAIINQAGLIDNYARQRDLVTQIASEYSKAKNQVIQYANAVKVSGTADAQTRANLTAQLNAAQTSQARLAESLRNEAEQLKVLRVELRGAGIDTKDLASSQIRLTEAARTNSASLTGLADAYERYGAAGKNASTAANLFNDSGRTTLSFTQRLRGEVLSLISAYVGIYGAVSQANSALTAYNEKQAAINQLSLGTGGDIKLAANEYKYAADQADRLGIAVQTATKGYGKLQIALSLAGRSNQESRFLFESLSEVARVAGVSSDKLGDVFYAVQQIYSKGRVYAEEFNQQLGDALPGLLGVANKVVPNFAKAMKDGNVGLDQFVQIMEQYRKEVANQLPTAVNSLAANQERLNNQIYNFKILIAESGFADEYSKFVKELTTFFKSDDGRRFAEGIASGFASITKILVFLLNNLDSVGAVLKTVLFLMGSKAILGFSLGIVSGIQSLRNMQLELTASTVGLNTFQATLLRVQIAATAAFAAINVAFAAFQIGTILYEQSALVRQAGFQIIRYYDFMFTAIIGGGKIFAAEFVNIWKDILSSIINTMTVSIRFIIRSLQSAAVALGKDDIAKGLGEALDAITLKMDRTGDASADLRNELTKNLKAISSIEFQDPLAPTPAAASASPTATGAPSGSGTKAEDADAASVKKRIALREQLEKALEGIEARILKNESNTLSSLRQAIDVETEKIERVILRYKDAGGRDADALLQRLTLGRETLKAQITKEFGDKLFAEEERINDKLASLEAESGRKRKLELDSRLDAVRAKYAQVYQDIDKLASTQSNNGIVTSSADQARARAKEAENEALILEKKKFDLEELARLEKNVTEKVAERSALIQAQNDLERQGNITTYEARTAIKDIVIKTQPEIEALSAQAAVFAQEMLEAGNIDQTQYDLLISKLQLAATSAAGIKTELITMGEIAEITANSAVTAFDSVAQTFGQLINGTATWKDLLGATAQAFRQMTASILLDIAKMILKEQILLAIRTISAAFSGGSSASGNASPGIKLFHSGGNVGGSVRSSKRVDPTIFANAPRYHSGGTAGLAPDEYPAILQKGERVMTAGQQSQMAQSSNQASPQNIKVVNMIDSASVVSEGLSTQDGVVAIMNIIRANRSTIKSVLS